MSQLSDKIREYGQNRDTEGLEKLVNETNVTDLLNLVQNKVKTSNFSYTWNYLLQGLQGSSDEKRFKLASCLLSEIEKNDIPSNLSNTLINRLCMDLNRFKSEHLAELCNFCKNSIQSKNTLQMSWKDLLPELLNVLIEREHIEYNDIDYTGPEFKTNFIDTLCMTDWSPNIITSLTSMFIDMPLTKDEHLKVVNKLGTYIEKLTPLEVPAFIYQILRLCKNNSIRSIFLKLQNYFGIRIYEQNKQWDSDNNSESISDEIESSSIQDTIEAESTVLYHIHTSASLGNECIQEYLSSLKNLSKSPEYILHPFQLTLLFTIATISHYEETIFELIRPAIVKCHQEEIKKNNSSWFRDMIPTNFKVEDVFGKVIHFSLSNRDLTLQAMVNFSFVLLGIGSGLGRDPQAERQWLIGNMILLKIIKRKRNIAPTIIQMLSNNIVTGHNVTQYIECLYILSRSFPLLMIENQSCIVEMMESLIQMPGPMANQLLDAIAPLTKVSPTIRDHLIILLRKSLYSRVLETRQMAVSGFLKLLSIMKISNLAILSQSSNSTGSFTSGHSLFTQLSLNRSSQSSLSSFSNEALCLEVLSILKRCFMQQAQVRAKLYEGLYDTVCTNLELGIPVLDVMLIHLQNLYATDEEQLPPLKFDEIVAIRDVEAVLEEPLGKLIYAAGLTVCKMADIESDHQTVIKFHKILDSISRRMIQCELVHFNLDDGTDLLDVLPECQKKVLILKEALNVYEALIGYKILSWNKDSENNGKEVNNLFQGYSRLHQFSKTLLKPKKDTRKKNKNQSTQNNTELNTQGRREQKVKNIKMPDSLWSNKIIVRALELLHETFVSWIGPGKATPVKTKREFHQHVMHATMNIVHNIKNAKTIDSNIEKMHYETLCDISIIIYNRIIKRLNEFIDFDCTTAVLALECFQNILHLITTQYKSNFTGFIKKICKQDESEEENPNYLKDILQDYQKLFEMDEDEASSDPEIKKVLNFVVTTLALLSNQITYKDNNLVLQLYEWLKNLAYNKNVSHKVSIPFSNLLFEVHVKSRVSLTLLDNISIYSGDIIGNITEEAHDSEKFEFINEGSVHNVFLCLCACLKGQLEDIDSIIYRLKSEFYMITYPGEENIERKREYLKNKETGVCCQLCFIVTILTNLSNITLQPGNIAEAIFKNITALFCTLTSLTKYFMGRSNKNNVAFQGARFERLVKLAGKQLAPVVYKLILYIEETQKQQAENNQNKKKPDSSTLKSKVLRETRMIPKVVYEMEQFSKTVTQLSNKTKVDLTKYVGQGIVRDFRILKLKEVLKNAETSFVDTQQTNMNTTTSTNNDVTMASNSEQENESEEEASPPPSKKNKK